MAKLTVLLPTFNEAHKLKDCLESVKWADEILLVDSFSTDQTFEIASRYGARIVQHEYINSAKQKNWAIPQCRHEWVLQIDADERVDPALQEEIQDLLKSPAPDIDGYLTRTKNHIMDRWVRVMGLYPSYRLRLFRRDSGRFQDREVDARVIMTGKVRKLDNHVLHYGLETITQRLLNLDRYTRYESDERNKQGRGFGVIQLLARSLGVFLYVYFWQRGFTAGMRGLILAVHRADFIFWTYVKLWERVRPPKISNGHRVGYHVQTHPSGNGFGPGRRRAKVTVLLPTFNEADKIQDCLESVKWADELLVVDSFSTDRTTEIASGYGARVVQHEYVNSAKQKNWAIPQCVHEWVLQVDADERLEPALQEELQHLLKSPPPDVDGYRVPFKHHILGEWIKVMGLYPETHLRLFRRDLGRFQDREVDAHVMVPGGVGMLSNHFIHYGVENVSQRLRNLDRYTRYEADERSKQGRRFSVFDLVVRSIGIFFYLYVWQRGFTAGMRGLILAAHRSDFVFWTYAKLWEKEQRRP